MSSIVWLIAEKVDQILLNDMQTTINDSDATRAGLVRVGRLQQNPIAPSVSLLTHVNDPDNIDNWLHEIIQPPPTSAMIIPSYQIGGGEMWWRRFTTEIIQFWKQDVDRTLAHEYASIVLSRAEHSISTAVLALGPDSFGEVAGQSYVIKSKNIEGGGPQNSFIWRGKIWWQVLTEKGL